MKLSIGIVNFESGYRLRQCIDGILANPPSVPYEVLVVDNASRDGSVDSLVKEPVSGVTVVVSRVNLLFTGGVNLAFARTSGEYFMILNPDMVPGPGAFDALVRHLDENKEAGAAAGQTFDNSGKFEMYVRRDPRPFVTFVGNFGGRLRDIPLVRKALFDLPAFDQTKPAVVPIAAGGCFAFRRSTFGTGQAMSREFGVFWSDGELCQRVRAGGRTISLVPGATFRHDHKSRDGVDGTPLPLVLDYLVGCATYFRMFGGRFRELEVKLLFGVAMSVGLMTKHLARAALRRQSWGDWRERAGVLWSFLVGRNELLLQVRQEAARSGDKVAMALL